MSELREQIEAAFEQDEQTQAPEEAGQESDFQAEAERPPEDAETDVEHSGETLEEPESSAETSEPSGETSEPPQQTSEPSEQPQAKPEKGSKAPASWTPKARETWASLPPEAQAEVQKREKEINQVLQQSAGARHAMSELNSVMEPYREGLIASGVQNPIQEIGNMLAVESRLRQGNQTEKAGMIAQLMQSYGVDVAELDTILSNQGYSAQSAPSQPPMNAQFEQMLNERMAPYDQFMAQQAQQQQYQQQQEVQQAHQTVAEFAEKAEFLNDVRNDMADLMDMATQRGQQMSIQEAYDKACLLNPEISQIMKAREEQQRLMGNSQAMQRKKAAASSITGLQGGTQTVEQPTNLRGAIEAAWDEAMGN